MKTLRAATLMMAMCLLAMGTAADANRINNRLERQSGRIGNGAEHHKMNSAQETRSDEADYRAEAEEQNMRGRHNGKLTLHDRRKLNRQLNRNSRRIHNDKAAR